MSDSSLDELFAALARSKFRARFRLNAAETEYLRDHGLERVMQHAADLIGQRLAPARPKNDGKQTPWKGHPVFVAQHATATCCRTCLQKWHKIPKGLALTGAQQAYVLKVLKQWLERHANDHPTANDQPRLFDS